MKLLLDTCVWGGAAEPLTRAGHDVEWIGDWEHDPGDERLLEYAIEQGRTLITLDKDFGDLVMLRGQRHAGIIRLVQIAARRQGELCRDAIEKYGAEITDGAIVTVEPGRVRIRQSESTD